jgi:hypothetical protein
MKTNSGLYITACRRKSDRLLDGSKITFDLNAHMRDQSGKARGFWQFLLGVTMHSNSRMISVNPSGPVRVFRVLEIDRPNWSKFISIPVDDVLPQIEADIGVIELTPEEDRTLLRFFSGAKRDATAVSGAFGRMLYFSS